MKTRVLGGLGLIAVTTVVLGARAEPPKACDAAAAGVAFANASFVNAAADARLAHDPKIASKVASLKIESSELASLVRQCRAAEPAAQGPIAANIQGRTTGFARGVAIVIQATTSVLTALGQRVIAHSGPACLGAPLADLGHPDCVVEDRSNSDGSVVDTIPSCASTGDVQPCWRYVSDPRCPAVEDPIHHTTTQGSIQVSREENGIPPGTHLRVACATLAHQEPRPVPIPLVH